MATKHNLCMTFALFALAFFSACPEPTPPSDPVPTVIALDGKEIPLVSSDLSAGEVKAVIARIQAAYGAMSAGDKAVFAGKTVKTVNIAAENDFSINGTEITFSFTASAAEAEISGVFSNCAVQLAKCNCAEGTSRYQDEPACGGNNCQCDILTAPATASMGTEIAAAKGAGVTERQAAETVAAIESAYNELSAGDKAILAGKITGIAIIKASAGTAALADGTLQAQAGASVQTIKECLTEFTGSFCNCAPGTTHYADEQCCGLQDCGCGVTVIATPANGLNVAYGAGAFSEREKDTAVKSINAAFGNAVYAIGTITVLKIGANAYRISGDNINIDVLWNAGDAAMTALDGQISNEINAISSAAIALDGNANVPVSYAGAATLEQKKSARANVQGAVAGFGDKAHFAGKIRSVTIGAAANGQTTKDQGFELSIMLAANPADIQAVLTECVNAMTCNCADKKHHDMADCCADIKATYGLSKAIGCDCEVYKEFTVSSDLHPMPITIIDERTGNVQTSLQKDGIIDKFQAAVAALSSDSEMSKTGYREVILRGVIVTIEDPGQGYTSVKVIDGNKIKYNVQWLEERTADAIKTSFGNQMINEMYGMSYTARETHRKRMGDSHLFGTRPLLLT